MSDGLKFKKEIILDQDGFFNQLYRNDLNSLAQIIQNIIIIEPGTYPNKPDLGIGIENYLFEPASTSIRQELTKKITEQIENYAPIENGKVEVLVETSDKNKKLLYINILLSSNDDYSIVKNLKSNAEIQFLFGLDKNKKSLVSKIIL